jgi:5'-nucleotidase
VRYLAAHPSLSGAAFNVNVPFLPENEVRGIRLVRQGRSRTIETFEKRMDPRGNVYYWMSGEKATGPHDMETDIGALAAGYITVTPICYDLTRYAMLDA